jgi:membrane protease YdiL (CAAX protease family)
MPQPFLRTLNPLLKLAYFFSLFLISLGVALVLSILVVMMIDGGSFSEVQKAFEEGSLSDNVFTSEILNFVSQAVNFLAPALFFVLIFGRRSVNGFWFKKTSWVIFLVPVLLVAASPFVEWTSMLNDWLIPEGSWLESWAKPMEEEAQEAVKQALAMSGREEFLRNILFIAIVPAFCEEIAFRGVIQSLISKASGNVHVGIWAAAILFSLIHFQFYGFIPRMLLGAFFGYLLIWTGSIWAPILAHFTNNALAVCTHYFYQHGDDVSYYAFEEFTVQLWPAVVAVIAFAVLCFVLIKRSKWKEIKPAYLWYESHPRRPIHPMEN